MNLTYIVVGDINHVMGEYNVDVRLIDVEEGTIVSAFGNSWLSGQSYRSVLQELAENLKKQMNQPGVVSSDEAFDYAKLAQKTIDNKLYEDALSYATTISELLPDT